MLGLCKCGNRVCPLPKRWIDLQPILDERAAVGSPAPKVLVLGGWYGTVNLVKMVRVREQVRWAASHGCLDAVGDFLQGLREEDWHHLDEGHS